MFSDDRVKGSACFSIGSGLPDHRELHTAHVPVCPACIQDNEKCPLQLLSVLFKLYL